jgi:hypothetical protein
MRLSRGKTLIERRLINWGIIIEDVVLGLLEFDLKMRFLARKL